MKVNEKWKNEKSFTTEHLSGSIHRHSILPLFRTYRMWINMWSKNGKTVTKIFTKVVLEPAHRNIYNNPNLALHPLVSRILRRWWQRRFDFAHSIPGYQRMLYQYQCRWPTDRQRVESFDLNPTIEIYPIERWPCLGNNNFLDENVRCQVHNRHRTGRIRLRIGFYIFKNVSCSFRKTSTLRSFCNS